MSSRYNKGFIITEMIITVSLSTMVLLAVFLSYKGSIAIMNKHNDMTKAFYLAGTMDINEGDNINLSSLITNSKTFIRKQSEDMGFAKKVTIEVYDAKSKSVIVNLVRYE